MRGTVVVVVDEGGDLDMDADEEDRGCCCCVVEEEEEVEAATVAIVLAAAEVAVNCDVGDEAAPLVVLVTEEGEGFVRAECARKAARRFVKNGRLVGMVGMVGKEVEDCGWMPVEMRKE